MIISDTIKLKLTKPVTNDAVEAAFAQKGLNVIRWAITEVDGDIYTLRISLLSNN